MDLFLVGMHGKQVGVRACGAASPSAGLSPEPPRRSRSSCRGTRRLCGGRCARCSSSRGHGGFQGAGTWHCVLRSGTVTAEAKPPPPGSAGRGTAGTPVLVAADQPFQRPARHGTVVTVSDALRAAPAGPGSALPLVGGRSGATSPQPPSPGRLRPREDKTEVGVPSGRPPAHSGFSPERSDGLVAGTEDAPPAR